MPLRYGTLEEELALCLEHREHLLAQLADLETIIAGLQEQVEAEA
jgi:hypothetical protein